jgi:hypothetical protein
MNILEAIEKKGAREVAHLLANKKVYTVCGLSIDDLPDTGDLCFIIDELQMILESYQIGSSNIEDIKEILGHIDLEFLESILLS